VLTGLLKRRTGVTADQVILELSRLYANQAAIRAE
jgi:hypothetical protein